MSARRASLVAAGVVLAVALAACAAPGSQRAVHWSPRSVGTLHGLPDSIAVDVNDRGQVVGLSSSAGLRREHAFLSKGRMRDLGTLGGPRTTAVAINDRGQVAGTSFAAAGEQHAFLWEHGRMKDLGTGPVGGVSAINDRGQVVGSREIKGIDHAVLWQRRRFTDLGTFGSRHLHRHQRARAGRRLHEHGGRQRRQRLVEAATAGGSGRSATAAPAVPSRSPTAARSSSTSIRPAGRRRGLHSCGGTGTLAASARSEAG